MEVWRRGIVGNSPGILAVHSMIDKVAPTDAPVLILGETGTGKELVAKAIHAESPRANGPFLSVSCAALPRDLLESTMFGHKHGAFTGAVSDHQGMLAACKGGTFFLDEIGDMEPCTQMKVLRALQEYEVTPVGSNRSLAIDVRILAATNRNLATSMRGGSFREDLYYRLSVIEITMPPLRDRSEDIGLLIAYFAHGSTVTDEAMRPLLRYDWPGNVRQLQNVIERALILCGGGPIEKQHLHPAVLSGPQIIHDIDFGRARMKLEEVEKAYIREALEKCDWHPIQAAKILGIHPSTLYRKRLEYGMAGPRNRKNTKLEAMR
jgi:transcriptional regulator with PAS, ATPase and Fis domain